MFAQHTGFSAVWRGIFSGFLGDSPSAPAWSSGRNTLVWGVGFWCHVIKEQLAPLPCATPSARGVGAARDSWVLRCRVRRGPAGVMTVIARRIRGRREEGDKGKEAVRLQLTLLCPPTAVPEMAAARLHAVGGAGRTSGV